MQQKGIEINFKGDLCEACYSHMQNDPEKSTVFFKSVILYKAEND